MGKLAYTDVQILDGQDGMSKKGDSPECEYRRRLRERGAIDFYARWSDAKRRMDVLERHFAIMAEHSEEADK